MCAIFPILFPLFSVLFFLLFLFVLFDVAPNQCNIFHFFHSFQHSYFLSRTYATMRSERCQIHLAFEKIFFSDEFTLDCTYGDAETSASIQSRRDKNEVLSDEELMTDEEDFSKKKYVRKHWRNMDRFNSLLDGEHSCNPYYFFYESELILFLYA